MGQTKLAKLSVNAEPAVAVEGVAAYLDLFLVLPFSRAITVEKSLPTRRTSLRRRERSCPPKRGYSIVLVNADAGAARPARIPAKSADLLVMMCFRSSE